MSQTQYARPVPAPAPQSSGDFDDSPRQTWHADWGNVLLVGGFVYAAIYALWIEFEWGDARTLSVVRALGFLPVIAAGVVFSWRTARFAPLDRLTRRAWALIMVGFALWLVASATRAYYELTTQAPLLLSLADLVYLARIPFFIVGVLSFPAGQMSRVERTKFWLDAGTILLSYTILAGYFVLGLGAAHPGSELLEGVTLLIFLFASVLVKLTVLSVLARRPTAASSFALLVLAAGMLVYTVTDLIWSYMVARDVNLAGGRPDALWMIGLLLIAGSPQVHFDLTRRRLSTSLNALAGRARLAMPYVASALVAALVLFVGIPQLIERLDRIPLFVIILTVVVAARQIVTLRENAQLRIEQAVRRSEERFQALVEHSSDLITVIDRQFQCVYQSPSSHEITGVEASSFMGTNFLDWMHTDDWETARPTLQHVIDGEDDTATLEWRFRRPDGGTIRLESVISNQLANPNVRGLVINSRDSTERKLLEEELAFRAYHDPLTGLPNRSGFSEMLAEAIAEIRPRAGIAVLFLDVDDLKRVNDSAGHESGDQLLRGVSRRLEATMRPDDRVGRIAGDEFVILLKNIRESDEAVTISRRISRAIQAPLNVGDHEMEPSASIGVVFTTSPDSRPSVLLRHADAAMYVAKRSGRGRVALFEPELEAQLH